MKINVKNYEIYSGKKNSCLKKDKSFFKILSSFSKKNMYSETKEI